MQYTMSCADWQTFSRKKILVRAKRTNKLLGDNKGALLIDINKTNIEIWARICDYMHIDQRNVITNPSYLISISLNHR